MYKHLVYIEEEILNHPNTLQIVKVFKDAYIVTVKHYKDVFNQSSSNWRLQKGAQKIILAKRKDTFFYKGSEVTPNFGFDNFYYNTIALNCIYDCDYCYLQGLFTSAHLVIFVNSHDFISETKTLIQSNKQKFYFALSYDTDLMAIENWYPFCKEWIDFANKQTNLTIEIRTKSANYLSFKNYQANNNTIIAFTLSPQQIIEKHEPKTPALKHRLKALKFFIEKGWRVRICIDPILYLPNWENYYSDLIQEISEEIDLNKIDSVSLGVFRMNKEFLKNIQSQRSDTPVVYSQFELKNQTYSYPDATKNKMLNFIKQKISTINSEIKIEII